MNLNNQIDWSDTDRIVSNDTRSELTSARRTKNGQPIPGFSEDFDYDPIGNRRSSATYNEKGEAQTSTYEANNLNQYTSRTTPGYAAVRGEADPAATVTVNENPTFRLGSYYYGSDLFDNSSSGGLATLQTYATLAQAAANGDETDDLISSTTNQVYLAQSPETFAYDDDGNQTLVTTRTGRWRVTYNGENRPVLWENVSTNSPTPNSTTPSLISMSYDHMGRRREKNNQRFFYDGYLQVANFHSPTPTQNSNYYIWDCTEPVATRPLAWCRDNFFGYYAHDGNKNVSEVIATDVAIAAHYEYTPFGALIVSCGESAESSPWRFSSEYAEDDTATVYYNYRHYEPVMGRWLGRGPLEENGGCNLVVFVANRGRDRTDYLGLSLFDYIPVWGTIKSAIDNYLGHIQGESVVDYPFVSPYDCKCNEESAEAKCIRAVEKQAYEYVADATIQLAGGVSVDAIVTILGAKANLKIGGILFLNTLIDTYIKLQIYSKIMEGTNSAMRNNCDCSQYMK